MYLILWKGGFQEKGQDSWVLKLLSKLVHLRGIRGMPIKECHVVDTHIQVRKISMSNVVFALFYNSYMDVEQFNFASTCVWKDSTIL